MNQQPPIPQSDDTVLDLATAPEPTAAFAASPLPTAPARPSGPTDRRRTTRRLAAGAVVLALAVGAATAVVAGGGSSTTATPAAGAAVGPAAADPTTATLPPGEPGGAPQTDVPEAQPEPPAAPGVLAVNTTAIWLFAGDYDGTFTVRNDGGSPIDWSFQGGIGAIGVSQSGGTLAPGASTVVSFSINPFQLADGPFVFVNHVVGGGFDKAITIHGVKTPIVVNPDIPKGPQNLTP